MRGGEKVLDQLSKLFPKAPIHTLVYNDDEKALSESIRKHTIISTYLNKLPGVVNYYKSLLPLFPKVIKKHKVDADFILSSDANLVKGMQNVNNVPHVCYCYSPPRYLWDLQDEYLQNMKGGQKQLFQWLTPYLQKFDREAAENVNHFIGISKFVQDRIKRIYKKESAVIYPPVNFSAFEYNRTSRDFYLIVSALVPYKKVDLAIRAFNNIGQPLVIIGDGSERKYLQTIAGDNIKFLGTQPFEVLKSHYEHCKAFIFPGIEDFGITPLEAQAAGKPVIAFKKGGALETVKEEKTGLFFKAQTPASLIDAINRFERNSKEFSPVACRENAELFSPERFKTEIKQFLTYNYPSYFSDFNWGC